MKKRTLGLLMIIALVSVFTACNINSSNSGSNSLQDSTIENEDETANALSLDLFERKELTLNGAEGEIVWVVTDTTVLAMENNVVKPKKVGTTSVLGVCGDKSVKYEITVMDSGERPNLILDKTEYTLADGGSLVLNPKVKYKNGYMDATLTVSKKSGVGFNVRVEDGKIFVTGESVGTGTFTIDCTIGDYVLSSIEVEITVINGN